MTKSKKTKRKSGQRETQKKKRKVGTRQKKRKSGRERQKEEKKWTKRDKEEVEKEWKDDDERTFSASPLAPSASSSPLPPPGEDVLSLLPSPAVSAHTPRSLPFSSARHKRRMLSKRERREREREKNGMCFVEVTK